MHRRTHARIAVHISLILALAASALAQKTEWVTGYVLKADPKARMFTFRPVRGTGKERTAKLPDGIPLIVYAPATREDIHVGDYVKTYGRISKEDKTIGNVGLVCKMMGPSAHVAGSRLDGKVVALDDGGMSVDTKGTVYKAQLSDDCDFEALKPGSLDLLRPGMNVAFSGVRQGNQYVAKQELRFYTGKTLKKAMGKLAFPDKHPEGASYLHPREGQALDVSPPGFCWWRLLDANGTPAGVGTVSYRLIIRDEGGKTVYTSPLLADPVCVPDRALPEGKYVWTAEGLLPDGTVADTWPEHRFEILPNALAQPWKGAEALLARVPREHPRLLFLKKDLPQVKAELDGRRKEAFEHLKGAVKTAMKLEPMGEPDYDEIQDPAKRRIAYGKSFWVGRRHHESGMRPLAMMYLLTGDEQYAAKAKTLLMEITEWDPEGISSVMAPYGDEIGLGIAKAMPQTYDWLYEYLSPTERETVEKNLAARADQILRRLRDRSDFLYRSGESHNGRLIAYLGEFACCLAEHPRAPIWLDYSMRGQLTVFPHWGGSGGGWNEGIGYGRAYNNILLPPMESISRATGFDLWQRPFFKRVRYFFMYPIAVGGELQPYGDGEQGSINVGGYSHAALLRFHASKFKDPAVAWFADHVFHDKDGTPPKRRYIPDLFAPPTVKADEPPADLAQDRAFFGIGWAAMHSDITHPERDLFLTFKSSPYGGVSHSYADQNTFVVMKGGAALAALSGAYYPTYGAPFHADYTRQTESKNGILVNGEGQIVRKGWANGRLVDFRSMGHMTYALGDAANAYGERLSRFNRHVLFVKPSLIVIADDLEAPEASSFQWLLQGREAFSINEKTQSLVSHRKGKEMRVRLFTDGGFAFSQTDKWPIQPDKGYPGVKEKKPRGWPKPQHHFTAETHKKTKARRIAAVLFVPDETSGATEPPKIRQTGDGLTIQAAWPGLTAEVTVSLGSGPVLKATTRPKSGSAEELDAK